MSLPLQVIPIGGLGELGMNCLLVGHRDRWVAIDCGVQFPRGLQPGVQRLLPDVRLLRRWRDRVEAIVVTHGHEDHIGALPWALAELGDVPVHATPFTAELIRHRLEEHDLWRSGRVARYEPGQRFTAGPFEVEGIRVTHSLPDCCALVLRCEDGTLLHTGDWKMDERPMDGEHFDRAAFERLGREGVTLMLGDSTNVGVPGRTRSEADVAETLGERIAGWSGRVIVSQFASNLHRLRGLSRAAEETGRQLVFAGGSLHRYLQAAHRDGRAPIEPSRVVDVKRAPELAASRTLLVSTGSQAEKRSALHRAALGDHPTLAFRSDDLVLHSARVIPGNEVGVHGMFNRIARSGAQLVHGRSSGIHTSGHAQRDELAELIDLVRPAHFIPLHGEYVFLLDHAGLARGDRSGPPGHVPEVTVLENGEAFGFGAGRHPGRMGAASRTPGLALESLYNDGPATGDAEEMRLKERLRIGWNGVVALDVGLRLDDRGRRDDRVEVQTRALWLDDGELTARIRSRAREALAALPRTAPRADMEDAVRRGVRAACRRRTGKRPDVMVFLRDETQQPSPSSGGGG